MGNLPRTGLQAATSVSRSSLRVTPWMAPRFSKTCRSTPRLVNALVLVGYKFTLHGVENIFTACTVGRTGSGKSTLTLSLLRCIFTAGNVIYDGLPTHSLNLDALRSNITIIPQVVSNTLPILQLLETHLQLGSRSF